MPLESKEFKTKFLANLRKKYEKIDADIADEKN